MSGANPTEPTNQNEPKDQAPQEPPRTFTQADMEAAIGERLRNERKKHAEELAKFADYEDMKAKAAKFPEPQLSDLLVADSLKLTA